MIGRCSAQKKLGTLPSTPLINTKTGSSEKYNQLISLRRRDVDRENLRSRSSASKRRVEFNESEPNRNREKRKRIRFVEEVTMESEMVEAHSEPVVMKRQRMTGHSFKARFKARSSKGMMPEKLPGIQSETLRIYQETEEQVQSIDPKKQCLKLNVICPQDSRTIIDSGRDRLLTEEDINAETYNVDEQRLHPTPSEVGIVKKNAEKAPAKEEGDENQILAQKKQAVKDAENEVEKDSPREEHFESQILSQMKQAVMDEGTWNEMENHPSREECNENHITSQEKQTVNEIPAGNEIDSLIKEIEESCHKKIKGFIKKQEGFRQEFQKNWEEKESALKKDHELRSALIRYIHREDSTRMVDKLKLLEGICAKEMENFNHLKDMDYNKLLTDQLAAENEERKKIAGWRVMAEACCSSVPRAVCGSESLSSQSEEVGVFSQSNTQDIVPWIMHNVEDKSHTDSQIQWNDVALSQKSGSPDPINDVGVAFSLGSGAEQLNQPENFGSFEIVPAEIRPVEVPPEVPDTAPNDVDYTTPVEVSCNSSDEGFDKQDETGLPVALVNQSDETDDTAATGLLEPEIVPMEIQPLDTNKEVPLEMFETVPNASVECVKPVELSNDSSDKWVDEGDDLLDASVNPVEETDGTPTESLEQILEPSKTQVSKDQIQQGLTVVVIQEQDAHVVEKQTSSIQVDSSEDADNATSEESVVDLPDQSVPVVEDQVASQIEGANLRPLDSVNPVQDEATRVVEKQNSSPFDVPASDRSDTITTSLFNLEVQDQEPVVEEQVALQIEVDPVDTVDPVQSDDALPIRNDEELHNESSDVSPSCGQPMSIEVESQSHNTKRNSSQIAQIEETEVVPQESASRSWSNQELPLDTGSESRVAFVSIEIESHSHNTKRNSSQIAQIEETEVVPQESASRSWSNQELPLDAGSESRVAPETNIEASTSSQNNVALSQTVVTTVEFSHQAALQPGSFDHLYGQNYLFPDPNHQVTSWMSPPLFSVPLQNEMERIRKETEQLQKSHEDMVAQLRSDRENEIEEVIAQINKKYELKLQESESEFSLKKKGLDKNHFKVLQSKLLSEVFGSTCMGYWSFGLPAMQRGNPPESMQLLPLQRMLTPPPVSTSPGQPASTPLIAGPNLQAVQQLLLPQSLRPSPVTSQNFMPSPVQNMHQAPLLPFTSASRPLAIAAITPTGGNPSFSGGTPRFTPPHLQPLGRPPPFRPIANLPPRVFQNRPQLQGGLTGQLSQSALTALRILMDVDDRPNMPSNHANMPRNHALGSLEQTYWARLQNPQGNMTSSGMSTDTICLSDEE